MTDKKKVALLIGINYTGTSNQLKGCQNDIIKIKPILIDHYGYKTENIVILMDKTNYISPTLLNIKNELIKIYTQTTKNIVDEICIYYSGHGTNITDRDKDEPDKKDECIVPLDYKNNGLITDDYIYSFLSKLKPVKKILMIFDSCNSASCSDLPYSFTIMRNKIIKQNLSKKKPIVNNQNIFVLSGCFDNKYSYDVTELDGTPCGLLSYNLRKTLDKYNYSCTIEQLLLNIKSGFGSNDQTPVLSVNSNKNILSTLMFESNKIITQITINKPTNKISPDIIKKINEYNKQINNLNSQFNEFNKQSKNITQEQANTKINLYVEQYELLVNKLKSLSLTNQ